MAVKDPVLIGGVGGSGTRLIAAIARQAGVVMHGQFLTQLNIAHDCTYFAGWYKEHQKDCLFGGYNRKMKSKLLRMMIGFIEY